MQVLTSSLDYAGFLRDVARAGSRVLLLDYDGTLAPFRIRPEEARPYPEVVPVLQDIVRTGSARVVIVSGRPARELPPLIGLEPRPEIWGSHGWERLDTDGTLVREEPSAQERAAIDAAARAASAATVRGARLERKGASIAAHWRGLAEDEANACRDVLASAWAPYAQTLELLPFDGGLELRARGCNKQHAVKAVLAQTASDAAIAYLGDDITDEDAFRAVRPRGIALLVRPEFRQTAADVWLRPPEELVQFLGAWCVR
jgi:trehalose-phosphatase